MPQSGDPVAKALSSAKSTLSHANAAFPSSVAPKAAPPKVAVKVSAPKPASSTGEPESGVAQGLAARKANVDQYTAALPKLHNGGPVLADGGYQLRAGEHVLTASETAKARKHAIMASGMKSLAKPGKASSKKAKE